MFSGLPGGSSDAGPATWTGVIVIAILTLLGFAALVSLLFQAVP